MTRLMGGLDPDGNVKAIALDADGNVKTSGTGGGTGGGGSDAIASTIWTDNSGAYYVRRDIVDSDTGTITVTFVTPTGTAATPGAGLRPLASTDRDVQTAYYEAIASGTGYSTGDLLARTLIIDANPSTPSISAIWLNFSTGLIISPPLSADIQRADEIISSRLIDGAGNQATIKAASTQPAFTDTAIVTSSRDWLPVSQSINITSGNSLDINVLGYSFFTLNIPLGTYNVTFLGAEDAAFSNILVEALGNTSQVVFTSTFTNGTASFFKGDTSSIKTLRISVATGTVTGTLSLHKKPALTTAVRAQILNSIAVSSIAAIALPTVRLQTYIQGTIATSGDNTIITAPTGGQRIFITKIRIQSESTATTTVLLKSGASTVLGRLRCVTDGDGTSDPYSPGHELRLGSNEAFILNLSGANTIGYSIEYYVA